MHSGRIGDLGLTPAFGYAVDALADGLAGERARRTQVSATTRERNEETAAPMQEREAKSGTSWRARLPQWASGRLALGGCALIMAIGLGLRLLGIAWGAPDRLDFNYDEDGLVMQRALQISWSNLDERYPGYPSFLYFLIAGTCAILRRLGVVSETWHAYLVGRHISVFFGVLTVAAAFALARRLGGRNTAAMLAALWVALLPLHVWESHFAATDVLMTFWITAALVASLRLFEKQRSADYALAGALCGLATGSKYTAALVFVAPAVAAVASGVRPARAVRLLAVAAVAGLAACFIVTPFTFIQFADFWQGMEFENQHVHGGHYGFSLPAPGPLYRRYIYQLAAAWPFSFGFALYACALVGVAYAARRLGRRGLVVLAFAGVFFGVTGSWTFTPLRYSLPILVIGAVLAGLWQEAWLAAPGRARRLVGAAAVVATAGYTGIFTYQTTDRFRHDTRIEAGDWIRSEVPAGTNMLFLGYHPYMAWASRERHAVHFAEDNTIGDVRFLQRHELIQLSSMMYERAYRHRNAMVHGYHKLRVHQRPFTLVKRFTAPFLNKAWYRYLDPMFEGYFVSPTIELYVRDDKLASYGVGGAPPAE
ncbi:MAG: glycosyltransferase family 39 protein [Candidatus Schekmanbacteria bacterium]|nr:glycosyltransferase family 39 protein [Candidatus Schekmanbacteria bacterium]